MIKTLLLGILLVAATSVKYVRKFNFKNKCPQPVWVGAFAVPLPPITGWEMKTGE